MKKFTLSTTLAIVITLSAIAQTPQAIQYQAVARDNAGIILVNQAVSLRMSIHEGSVIGTVIFRETHSATTNQFGLVDIEIGNGIPDIGIFSTIDWGSGSRYLETEIDPAGGNNFIWMGTVQLLSVPYALYSENTAHKDDADADPANELQTLSITGNDLSISNGNTVTISGSIATSKISDTDGDTWVDTEQTSDNDSIRFVTGGTERARILPDGTIEVEGTVAANLFVGNGSGLTGVPGDNLGNHTANFYLNMSNQQITNLADPSVGSDAATKQYVDSNGDNLGNHTAQFYLNMSNMQITNLGDPTSNNDAATKQYVDNNGGDNLGDHMATQNIKLNYNWLSGDGGNEGVFIKTDGKVGIGTNDPSEKLHVLGKARILGGVSVDQSTEDGVYVFRAGNPSLPQQSGEKNGFEVAGAEGNGLFVGRADSSGISIASAGKFGMYASGTGDCGVYIGSSGNDGFIVDRVGTPVKQTSSPEKNGFEVGGAEGNGLFVGWAHLNGVSVDEVSGDGFAVGHAGNKGIKIGSTGSDGFYVESVGNPSSQLNSYHKNGFEVAGAEGNGLFVGRADESGVYVNETGEEGLQISYAGSHGIFIYDAGGKGVSVYKSGSDGFSVESAGNPSADYGSVYQNGFEVGGAEGNGLYVGRADESGVFIWESGQKGVSIGSTGGDGFVVGSVGNPSAVTANSAKNGFEVGGAEGHGLYVGQADMNGVFVESAGNPTLKMYSTTHKNGFEVAGAEDNGLFVGHADGDGVNINHTFGTGIYVGSVGYPVGTFPSFLRRSGFEVAGAEGYGLYVGWSDTTAIFVNECQGDGVNISHTYSSGFSVYEAGNPSTQTDNSSNNGFEVAGAEGNGLYVGRADEWGVQVFSAGKDGFYVAMADGNGVSIINTDKNGFHVGYAAEDGLNVTQAGENGVTIDDAQANGISVDDAGDNGIAVEKAGARGYYVNDCADGLYVNDAADDGVYVSAADDYAFFGNTTMLNREWGFYTPDQIHAYNVFSKGNSTYAKNTGNSSLEPGDIVCIAGGLEENVLDGEGFPVVNINKATQSNSQAVFGIVQYKVTIREELEQAPEGETAKTLKSFENAEGNVMPGDYLAVVVFGQAEVKVSDTRNIQAGQKLTISESAGKARTISNLDNWADTGILGKALEDSDGKGTIKVYVNCR
nr:hypothetical protein [Bacteroidota bacterium]